jgi:TLD
MRLTSFHYAGTRSYGSGECFVFKQNGQSVDVFKWTRANKFFQWSSHEHLAIGGGGHFALWLDTDLASGTTAVCSTFGNPPLTTGRRSLTAKTDDNVGVNMSEMVDFEIVVIEAWVPVLRGHLPSG